MKALLIDHIISVKSFAINYRKSFIVFAKIIIAFGLLYYLVKEIDYTEIIKALYHVNYFLLFSAFILSLFNLFFQFKKWQITCNILLNEFNDKKILTSLFYGFSAGIFTPARLGEFVGRGILFNDKPFIKISSSILIDKLCTFYLIILFGLISASVFAAIFYSAVIVSIFLAAISLIMIFLIFKSYHFKKRTFKIKNKYLARFQDIIDKADKRFIKINLLYSFLFYLCYIIQLSLLAAAFSGGFKFIEFVWISSLIMMVKTIIPSISLGELGIREGASIFFFTKIGELSSVGFNAAIFLFIINLLIPSLIGLLLLLKRKYA